MPESCSRLFGHIPLGGGLLLFLLGGLCGLYASYAPTMSAVWLLWLSIGVLLYILIVLLVRRFELLIWVSGSAVLAAVLGSILLVTQYRHLGFDHKFDPVVRLGMWLSAPFPALVMTHIDANAAAGFLEGALPLAIGALIAASGWRRMLWSGSALVIAAGILLTSSRGSWVALATALLLGVLICGRSTGHLPRPLWWVIGLFVIVVLGGAISILSAPSLRGVLISATSRAGDRFTLYRNSFFLALDFPISGIGAGGTFGEIYSRFHLLIGVPFVGYAHNLFLSIWLAQGLLGLLGFCGLLLASLRFIWRGLQQPADYRIGALGWGATLGCTVVLLHGLTDSPQYDTSWPSLLMAFVLLGIAITAARLIDDRPLAWLQLGPRSKVVLLLLVASCLVLAGPTLLSALAANKAAILQARALLRPELDAPERTQLRIAAIAWADWGLQQAPGSLLALKRRGLLALAEEDFAGAIQLLEPALRRSPADQSICKALGYAYIWDGQLEKGVVLLRRLDRTSEVAQELDVWPFVWRNMGRTELAERAEQAALLMASK